MTLLRALVSRFSALLGDVYYEGTVPPDAPYPYAVISAKIPAAFGGTGEITLCCYERGGGQPHADRRENGAGDALFRQFGALRRRLGAAAIPPNVPSGMRRAASPSCG